MKNKEAIYTHDDLEIALLKNTNETILQSLQRIENRQESNFHWTMNLIFGLYALGIGSLITALGKAYNWF